MAPYGVAHSRLISPGSVHICLYRTDAARTVTHQTMNSNFTPESTRHRTPTVPSHVVHAEPN